MAITHKNSSIAEQKLLCHNLRSKHLWAQSFYRLDVENYRSFSSRQKNGQKEVFHLTEITEVQEMLLGPRGHKTGPMGWM